MGYSSVIGLRYINYFQTQRRASNTSTSFHHPCLSTNCKELSGTANLKKCHLEKACGSEEEKGGYRERKGRKAADGSKRKKDMRAKRKQTGERYTSPVHQAVL